MVVVVLRNIGVIVYTGVVDRVLLEKVMVGAVLVASGVLEVSDALVDCDVLVASDELVVSDELVALELSVVLVALSVLEELEEDVEPDPSNSPGTCDAQIQILSSLFSCKCLNGECMRREEVPQKLQKEYGSATSSLSASTLASDRLHSKWPRWPWAGSANSPTRDESSAMQLQSLVMRL